MRVCYRAVMRISSRPPFKHNFLATTTNSTNFFLRQAVKCFSGKVVKGQKPRGAHKPYLQGTPFLKGIHDKTSPPPPLH